MSKVSMEKMIEKSEEMLKFLSNNKSIDLEEFNSHVVLLRQIIKLNPESSKKVGLLKKKPIATKKLHDSKFNLVQVPVLDGHVSIGHRPKFKDIPLMKRVGVSHVLTLLSRREGAEKIGESVNKWNLEWIWHPMENATPPGSDQYEKYLNLFKKLQNILELRGFIHVHCSAGIHRTGMTVFALLLYIGFNEN